MSLSVLRTGLYLKMFYQFAASYGGAKHAAFLSPKETVRAVLDAETSLIRFGDGEFDIMEGKSIHYQRHSPELAEALKTIAQDYLSGDAPYLLCMPGDYLKDSGRLLLRSQLALSCWSHARYYFNKWHDKPVQYGDAFLFRKKNQSVYEKLWTDFRGSFVFVHNDVKYRDAFQEAYKTKAAFVRVPPENAFEELAQIERDTLSAVGDSAGQDVMALISAGPCGKVLAYRLAREGIRAIDTGHCWDDPLV